MTVFLANNVSSALAAPITASATSMTVTNGSRFPVLTPGQYFYATIIATNGIVEIVKVNTRNGNAMSITRAQDGTNAQAFASGARVEMRINAASVKDVATDTVAPIDARLTTAEGDITALEGRMTTAEGDITTIEGDIVALENFDTALATSTGSTSVGFLQAGTGASLRTVQSKLRDVLSVKDFGAVGDGIADDTAAFTAAFTAAGTNGCVYAPTSTYKISSEVTVTCSFYGDGAGTVIKPSGQHTALIIRTGRAGQLMAGYVGRFAIDFSGVSPVNSDCIGMWLSKGTTPAASSGCNNVLFSDIMVWQAYRGIQMLDSDLGNLWTTSFQNLLIFGSSDYGIYIDTRGSQGSLNVSFDNVTCDGYDKTTAKGAYIRGINNVRYFGTGTAITGGALSAFAMLDCSNVDVRLQIENITTTGNVVGLVGFLNCPTVELSLRSQTNTFDPGVGNTVSYVYLDTNVKNFVLKSFSPAGDVFSSGTTYKINCQNGGASNTRLTILDHSVLPSDVLASAAVINGSVFVVTDYALQKISTTRRQQALDVNVPNATATNLVSVADYANRPYQVAALYLVQGSFSGDNTIGFTDLILVTGVGQNVAQTAVAVSSNSINGGHARTYSISGGFLRVSISPGSGSYIVSATGFDQAGSAN